MYIRYIHIHIVHKRTSSRQQHMESAWQTASRCWTTDKTRWQAEKLIYRSVLKKNAKQHLKRIEWGETRSCGGQTKGGKCWRHGFERWRRHSGDAVERWWWCNEAISRAIIHFHTCTQVNMHWYNALCMCWLKINMRAVFECWQICMWANPFPAMAIGIAMHVQGKTMTRDGNAR